MEANSGNTGTATLSEPALISRAGSSPSVRFRRRCAHIAMAVAGVFGASLANATLIDFDDLPPYQSQDENGWLPTQVTDQYAALGVVFVNSGIGTAVPGVYSQPNGLTDYYGPGMEIHFTGLLPTSVSFYVSSFNQDAVGIDAFGTGGLIAHKESDGWRGTEENSTPYMDHQLISFAGSAISQLNLNSFYDRRGSLIIDDLMFTRDVASVPEPGTLGLLAGGIGLLILRRRHAA